MNIVLVEGSISGMSKVVDDGTLEYLLSYGVNEFYVQLVTNKIVEVHSFKTGKYLEKYFPNVKTEI